MRFIKHLTTWLLLLTIITASGLVSAKVASGSQNLSDGLHQGNVAANALLHLAKIDVSTTLTPGSSVVAKGTPSKATDTLTQIKKTGKAPPGYKGGKTFKNDGRGGGQKLPQKDASGNPINYKEYDVNRYQKGVNRGAERIVRGSNGKSYYTNDHYKTFNPIE